MQPFTRTTFEYYKKVNALFGTELSVGEAHKLESIIHSVKAGSDLELNHVKFEKELIKRIRVSNQEILDQVIVERDETFVAGAEFIIKEYNQAKRQDEDIEDRIKGVRQAADAKSIKYTGAFDMIGKALAGGRSACDI